MMTQQVGTMESDDLNAVNMNRKSDLKGMGYRRACSRLLDQGVVGPI